MSSAEALPLTAPLPGLADTRSAMVHSSHAMQNILDTSAKLQRAKERLYLLCQFAGWGGYLTINLFFPGHLPIPRIRFRRRGTN
jgi:hypothetical protein